MSCGVRSRTLRQANDSSRVVIPSVLCLNECDGEASKMRRYWPIRCCRAVKINRCKSLIMHVTIEPIRYDDNDAFCATMFIFLGINSSKRVVTRARLRWIYNRRSAHPDGCSLCLRVRNYKLTCTL